MATASINTPATAAAPPASGGRISTEDQFINPSENDRIMIALEASWEIHSLIEQLIPACPNEAEQLWQRGLLVRTRQLAELAMRAIGDDAEDVVKLRSEFEGIALPLRAAGEVVHD